MTGECSLCLTWVWASVWPLSEPVSLIQNAGHTAITKSARVGISDMLGALAVSLFLGEPHAPTPYAFIHWFKRERGRHDILEKVGCPRLIYEPPKRGSGGVYDVIHLSSICHQLCLISLARVPSTSVLSHHAGQFRLHHHYDRL